MRWSRGTQACIADMMHAQDWVQRASCTPHDRNELDTDVSAQTAHLVYSFGQKQNLFD
jgi:hypothetical protein